MLNRAFFLVMAFCSTSAFADEASDKSDIAAARKFVDPILSKTCEFHSDADGSPDGDNSVYQISYRTKGQDQDSPDNKVTLVQLACGAGAYNFSSVFVIRDGEGLWQIQNFATPVLDFDYTDENFTKLKAPPVVTGFKTTVELVNSEFDASTNTLSDYIKWRGIGDSWSRGDWQFEDGAFVLRRYEVDPTNQAPDDTETDPSEQESFVVYDASVKAK